MIAKNKKRRLMQLQNETKLSKKVETKLQDYGELEKDLGINTEENDTY